MKQVMQRTRSSCVKAGHKYGQQNGVLLGKQLDRPTEEILEEVRRRTTLEYDFGSTGVCVCMCVCAFMHAVMYGGGSVHGLLTRKHIDE